jgi:hypothetical protein
VWRGEALRELGRHREALKDLDREPAGAWTLINRALARDALGDLDGMRRDFGRLLPSIVAHIRRRIGRRAGGDLDEAGMRRVLRSGLSFGLGYRREADYGNAIWMSLGTGSRKPGR